MEKIAKLEYSGTLRVTDRCLDTYRKFARFVPEALPQNAIVVNVGGGENQTFENDLVAIRPDVKVITLDPSIHSRESVHQTKFGTFKYLSDEEISKRINGLPNKSGTLDAWGQKMPLMSDSVDTILDVHAASQWAVNLESYKQFLRESIRVLKVGGKLHIGNVYFGDTIPGNEESEISTVKETRDVFDGLNLDAEIFLSTERMFKGANDKQLSDRRVCAIVTKY